MLGGLGEEPDNWQLRPTFRAPMVRRLVKAKPAGNEPVDIRSMHCLPICSVSMAILLKVEVAMIISRV
jgi:hypothetical protein